MRILLLLLGFVSAVLVSAGAHPAAATARQAPAAVQTQNQAVTASPPLFFYNAANRSAAVGTVSSTGGFTNLSTFPAGAFGAWTDVTYTGGNRLFFYNAANRSAAVGTVSSTGGFTNLSTFPAGAFGAWTDITGRA